MSTQTIGDLARPLPGIGDEAEICDSCHEELYSLVGGRVLCACCAPVAEHGKQYWMCDHCGTRRVYGLGRPVETSPKMLNCERCERVQAHRFLSVGAAQHRTPFLEPRRVRR